MDHKAPHGQPSYLASMRDLWFCVPASRRVCLFVQQNCAPEIGRRCTTFRAFDNCLVDMHAHSALRAGLCSVERMSDASKQASEAMEAARALAEQLDAQAARGPSAQRDLWRLLVDLHQLERELTERRYVRRVDALERVQEGVRGLGEIGSAAGILDRSADGLGESSDFDRVVVSSIREGELHVESTWCRDDRGRAEAELAALRSAPVRLDYPLVEAELAGRQGLEVVSARKRSDKRWAEVLGWDSYAVATLALGGATVGFVHADCHLSSRAIDELDREVLEAYAEGLAQVFERAVLRGRLRGHRSELRGAVDWMNARLSRLSEASVASANGEAAPAVDMPELDEVLTPRELEVLRLMARGNTNVAIAKALVVAEGTVKYHVKNVLRKLRAANRADAVARYERMTAGLPE
jgi:LuxR family transcriptional regulator, regulator of acetate metabolism